MLAPMKYIDQKNRTRTMAKIARNLMRAQSRGETFVCARASCGRVRPMMPDDRHNGGKRYCSTTCAENDRHAKTT